MKYIIITCLLMLSFELMAQTDQEIKTFAKEYFVHYKKKDIKWIEKQYASSKEIITYDITTFNKKENKEDEERFTRFYPIMKRDYLKSFKEGSITGFRNIIEQCNFLEVMIVEDKEYENFKTVYIICEDKKGNKYALDPGAIHQTANAKMVIHAREINITPYINGKNLNDNMPEPTKIFKGDDLTYTAVVEPSKIVAPKPTNKIYIAVEQEASFPGGENGIYTYINRNINYPKIAEANQIEGVVYVSFVIEMDGSLSNAKIIRDIGGGCGTEALRVIKKMPKWKAAKNNGQTVRSEFTLPIEFIIPE